MPGRSLRMDHRFVAALCVGLTVALLLSGCIAPAVTVTPTEQTQSVSIATMTVPSSPSPLPPTETASPTVIQPFPLAGIWKGVAYNGDFRMTVTLTLSGTCFTGQMCGTIDLAEVPCRASFMLLSGGSIYEFKAGEKVGSCGEGRDFLHLLPDGSLLYTSRGAYGETRGVLVSEPASRRPVIFDDDGSPDGTTALLYLLSRHDVEVKAVGISYGEAHPAVYIQHMGRMMEDFGYTGIPLGAGMDGSLSDVPGFPEWLREAAGRFWDWSLPNAGKTYPVEDSAAMLIRLLNESPQPIDLFFSGPVTNLARALRQAPEIKGHIGTLYMMAGAVYVPGNVHDFYPESANVYADWNPYSDPLAYQEVFDAGIPMVLIPLDATNQVTVTRQDTHTWRAGGRLADFEAGVYDWLMKGDPGQSYIWDLLAAVVMTEPDLCGYKDLHLNVITEVGDHFGQMLVMPGAKPNVRVCLAPDAARVNQVLTEIFSNAR